MGALISQPETLNDTREVSWPILAGTVPVKLGLSDRSSVYSISRIDGRTTKLPAANQWKNLVLFLVHVRNNCC